VSGTALLWIQSSLTERRQFVKLGQHKSTETKLEVGVHHLFAVYCSPVADVITSHGVRHHQYADDTQLHLAMRADNPRSVHSHCLYCRRQTLVHAEWTPTESG